MLTFPAVFIPAPTPPPHQPPPPALLTQTLPPGPSHHTAGNVPAGSGNLSPLASRGAHSAAGFCSREQFVAQWYRSGAPVSMTQLCHSFATAFPPNPHRPWPRPESPKKPEAAVRAGWVLGLGRAGGRSWAVLAFLAMAFAAAGGWRHTRGG
jgi:hypothetical protein